MRAAEPFGAIAEEHKGAGAHVGDLIVVLETKEDDDKFHIPSFDSVFSYFE